jgi:hypothetical protein
MPRMFQLKCLVKELQTKSKDDCFYKLAAIVEQEETFVDVEDNIYPFSVLSLTQAYHQAYDSRRQASRLDEKVA